MENRVKHFDTLGVMVDVSRNAVMTLPQLKKFITILAQMGYNQVQLYMEDTYEVQGEPMLGTFRGRYSQSELCELDAFARSLGIELVPCIQTLAHLNAIFRWPEYAAIKDIDDILTVGQARTYALIENMVCSLRKCFHTSKIHIGMDEAHLLGRGRYADKNGFQDKNQILLSHLNIVCKITDKYGFEPMMWSDMFYRIANGGRYYAADSEFNSEIKQKIPKNLSLVYWDYYHSDKQTYTCMIKGHKMLTDRVIFAGGAWRWSGFTPHNEFSLRTTKAAFQACIESGVREAVITMWGDDGAECSSFSVLPTLCYAACLAQGITAMADVKEKFAQWVGYSFDDFMLLDLPDKLIKTKKMVNPSKYELYNDCFMGILDSAVVDGDGKKYASHARRLKNAAKRTGEYAYLFDAAAKLCSALSIKAELGIRTRKVCCSQNSAELSELIKDYKKAIKRIEDFYYAFRNQWYTENKPHGFDVQDMRLGGLMQRMKCCCERLCALESGKISEIPELLEPTPALYNEQINYNSWASTFTANVVSHYFS